MRLQNGVVRIWHTDVQVQCDLQKNWRLKQVFNTKAISCQLLRRKKPDKTINNYFNCPVKLFMSYIATFYAHTRYFWNICIRKKI